MKKMTSFIKNLRLDIIATYDVNEQEFFNCAVAQEALEDENALIKYIKGQLSHKDLVKLSLCWQSDDDKVFNNPTIQESLSKNAKYYFN